MFSFMCGAILALERCTCVAKRVRGQGRLLGLLISMTGGVVHPTVREAYEASQAVGDEHIVLNFDATAAGVTFKRQCGNLLIDPTLLDAIREVSDRGMVCDGSKGTRKQRSHMLMMQGWQRWHVCMQGGYYVPCMRPHMHHSAGGG